MKKNRASFFNETMDYYNTQMPNMIPNPNTMPNAMQYSMSQSGFYTGNMPQGNPYIGDDLNTRLAKLERQINRLEHRINSLEQNTTSFSKDENETTINNMYMV